MSFADWLDEQMQQRNLSAGDLARALKVSIATVAAWRAGRREPVPESSRQIATYFGVPAKEVIALTKWRGEE